MYTYMRIYTYVRTAAAGSWNRKLGPFPSQQRSAAIDERARPVSASHNTNTNINTTDNKDNTSNNKNNKNKNNNNSHDNNTDNNNDNDLKLQRQLRQVQQEHRCYGRFPKFHLCFFGPRPWHIEIRHRVKKTFTINLFGFETLQLKIRRLKLWKPTVSSHPAIGVISFICICLYLLIKTII